MRRTSWPANLIRRVRSGKAGLQLGSRNFSRFQVYKVTRFGQAGFFTYRFRPRAELKTGAGTLGQSDLYGEIKILAHETRPFHPRF
jgi:hypothetical protein